MPRRSFIAIVGHGPELEREEGAANVLRGLGADVRTLDLWDEPSALWGRGDDDEVTPRAVLIEAVERPDLAVAALRALRREPRLEGVGAIAAVSVSQIARIDPSSGFDDFVLSPYVPAELYARIRMVEWRRSEFATEERMKIGPIVVDRAARDVSIAGMSVTLTAKEFALLVYLCERRGKVVSREELLRRVWGNLYEGGSRTIDIHVRRLRAKLGPSLHIATLRGSGYRLMAPAGPSSPGSPGEAGPGSAADAGDFDAMDEDLNELPAPGLRSAGQARRLRAAR
jgi:DNA-binding winged helix-turn-helix (wHTH) protein